MTQQEKAIKIAEACGWKPYMRPSPPLGHDVLVFLDPGGNKRGGCPNYFGSLDACAEMRKSLKSIGERSEYARHLTGINKQHGGDDEWAIADETPEQHCEAFGRTLGLWV